MTVKEQLERAFWHHQQVRAKMVQLDRLRELKKNMDMIKFEPIEPKKPPAGRPEDVENSIEEMIEILSDEILDLFGRRWEIIDMINSLKNVRQQLVMVMRYLCSDDWEEIARTMNCTCDEIQQLHDKALSNLEKIHKQQKKSGK